MKEAEIEKMRNDFEAAVLTMSLEQKMLLLDFINHLEQGRAGKREMGSCEHLGILGQFENLGSVVSFRWRSMRK